nr:ORF1 [Torque teno Leptonychotes weddellii virus 2]
MARFWRRWRRRPRIWRKRRRYWRHFRPWSHRRRRTWRRRHFGHRYAAVRYCPAKRHRKLVVAGWEPLGNICATTTVCSEAKPYLILECDKDKIKETASRMNQDNLWTGSWGHHYFSFKGLIDRSQYFMNTFSSDWRSFDYLQFLGGYIWLPRQMYLDWLFYIDYDLQDKMMTPEAMDKYVNAKTWFSPGILLNRKGAITVGSPHRFGIKTMFRRLRIRPPANWEGLYNLPDAMHYIFVHWVWTWIDFEQSFMDSDAVKHITKDQISTVKPCEGVPWFWGGIDSMQPKADGYDPRASWVDREKYDCKMGRRYTEKSDSFRRWGPFNPFTYGFPYSQSRSLWFKYRFYFKLSGDSVYRRPPTEGSEDLIPKAPGEDHRQIGPSHEVPPRSILKRPLTPSDILPGDLDSDGILKEDALRRIVSSHRTGQPTMLVPKRVRFRIGRRDRQRKIHSLIRQLME